MLKTMTMNPVPFPSTLKGLRNTQRTRNIHQKEETEPNAKIKEYLKIKKLTIFLFCFYFDV